MQDARHFSKRERKERDDDGKIDRLEAEVCIGVKSGAFRMCQTNASKSDLIRLEEKAAMWWCVKGDGCVGVYMGE